MRKHGGTPSWRDKHVTPAANSPPRVARGRFFGGQQSGVAGCKPPPLFTRGASSCSSQRRRQGEPWGASPRPSAPTYLPTSRQTDRQNSLFRLDPDRQAETDDVAVATVTWDHENKEEEDNRGLKIEGKSLLHDFKMRKDSRQSQAFLFAQETEVMVRRVLMGLLQALNHGFHVCLFPSPLHAYVHIYYVGAFRWIEKVAS